MTTDIAVIDALAFALADLGQRVREGEQIAPGITPILHGWMPPHPDTAISLSVHGYPDSPNPDGTAVWRAQVRIRTAGSTDTLASLAEATRQRLTIHHQEWNQTRIARCYRYSVIPMGRDTSGRWERADNYQIITQ